MRRCTSNRDALALYRDLVGADRDVVRVRAQGAQEDGSVRLDTGVGLVSHSRDMLLAAACAQLAEFSGGLEVGLTWARIRPGPQPYRRVGFSANDAEDGDEAAA